MNAPKSSSDLAARQSVEELDDFIAPIIDPGPQPGPGGLIGRLLRWLILY